MWFNVLLFVVAVVAYLYYYLVRNYGVFEKMGLAEHKYDNYTIAYILYFIPIPACRPLVPAVFDLLMGKQNFARSGDNLYVEYPNEKMVGYHGFAAPTLLIRDIVGWNWSIYASKISYT